MSSQQTLPPRPKEMSTGSEDDQLPQRPRSLKRIAAISAAGLAFVAVFLGGWFAAVQFESPAQRAASAKPPAPSIVTAPVEQGDLSRAITTSATLSPSQQQKVSLAGREGDVVTAVPRPAGQNLVAGDVALEINGRPLIAVPGAFPFYRDLTVGDQGPDVRQLQAGLEAAGYGVSADGAFGAKTESALRDLYRAIDYPVPASTSASVGPKEGTENSPPSGARLPDISPAPPSAPVPAVSAFRISQSELLAVPVLPATVVASPSVGSRIASDSQISLESGTLQASSAIPPNVAATVRQGMAVQLTGPDGRTVDGSVQSIVNGAKPEDDSTVVYTAPAMPAEWRGKPVTAMVTIRVAASNALIVPSTAIVSQGEAGSYILKREKDGSYERIAVRETASLNGRSAIALVGAKELSAGDRVRVR